jgi:hypothetical protein
MDTCITLILDFEFLRSLVFWTNTIGGTIYLTIDALEN